MVSVEHTPRLEPRFTSIELFTGGGGLALGMHREGFRHLLVSEIDQRSCQTLRLNGAQPISECQPQVREGSRGGWPLLEGDVRQYDFGAFQGLVDVVAGGVPCQPWSLGGVAKGYEDPRNLWPEFVRVVRQTRPRAFLAENVSGLLRRSFAEYWNYTLDSLRAPQLEKEDGEDWTDHRDRLTDHLACRGNLEDRYQVFVLQVNAADYGVPQIRKRVFTLGFRTELGVRWNPPEPSHSKGALRATGAIVADRGPQASGSGLRGSAESVGKLPWMTLRDALTEPPRVPTPGPDYQETPGWFHHVRWPGARSYPGHTPNLLDRPAKTVKAGAHGVPGGESVVRLDDGSLRYLTVREVARIMTFPDDWVFAGPRGEQMRQLGNAVPVRLAQVAAAAVRQALEAAPKVDFPVDLREVVAEAMSQARIGA